MKRYPWSMAEACVPPSGVTVSSYVFQNWPLTQRSICTSTVVTVGMQTSELATHFINKNRQK